MSENNQMMSVQGQLIGMPLAGPESFSQQQLEYLKRALGVDETVLWTGSQSLASAVDITNLPESLQNFEYIRIHYKGFSTHSEMASTLMSTTYDATNNTGNSLLMPYRGGSGVIRFNCCFVTCNGTTLSISDPNQVYIQGGQSVKSASCNSIMTKVVGVHRISGGNQ